ncbi:MAG TPA: heavy metal translocating P-type ATPase [Gemmatimonadaceae bacterium]
MATRAKAPVRGLVLPALAVTAIMAGAAAYVAAGRDWATTTWTVGLVATGGPLLISTLRLLARGHFATDVVAMLAIIGAVLLGQPLAGLIVVVMQSGGEALERFAEGRASRAVKQLEADAPRIAHRLRHGLEDDIPVDAIEVGDELLVRPGEMVPCDCAVIAGTSDIDESRLTGEPLPVRASSGTSIMSGSLNLSGAIHVRASALASESQYARIVELVRSAAAHKAPLQRLADRYAVWFTPITLMLCGVAWAMSGDAMRALAVLVVATPCPLILATPIAIIGGINRAASRQIVIRTGGALEQLSAVRVVAFDKTGTLTVGRPSMSAVVAEPPFGERDVLRLAGALEQHSGYALARSVVDAAHEAFGPLPAPTDTVEEGGRGISGRVDGRLVSIGAHGYVASRVTSVVPAYNDSLPDENLLLRAWVAIDGRFAGTLQFSDTMRRGAREIVGILAGMGIGRAVLLSGDQQRSVRSVADAVGIRDAVGELLPADKLARVAALSETAGPVLMVGDATNDAPALTRADVGVVLAGHGGGVTAEAADVVILNDDLSRLTEAIEISRRTMAIARQSIWIGLGLSGVGMVFAAAGFIPPVVGALIQEGIDVAVIVNALRASVPSRDASETRSILREGGTIPAVGERPAATSA